jgi:hypothetical protein
MDKSKKKSHDGLLARAVAQTAIHFGVSTAYVYGSRNGTNKGGQTEDIKRHCDLIYNNLTKALKVPA